MQMLLWLQSAVLRTEFIEPVNSMYSRLAAPEPLVPTTAKRSPRHTVTDTSWNSCVSPSWDFATSSSTSSGSPREASGFAAGGLVRLSVAPVLRAAPVMVVAPLRRG
jgi:hypothetical protein